MATQPGKAALLALVVLGLTAIGNPITETTTFEDRAHAVLGPADLIIDGDRLVVSDAAEAEAAVLAIDVRGESAFNVYFEPVEIAVGEALTTTLRGPNETVIGQIDLVQRTSHSTDVILRIEDTIHTLNDQQIRVSTHLDGRTTHEATIDATPVMHLGTVQSSATAWAKTYHWFCINGDCSLLIDPDDTVMHFANDPGAAAAFQYLAVHLDLGDAAIAQPTQVEFGGAAVKGLVITGEDTVPVTVD